MQPENDSVYQANARADLARRAADGFNHDYQTRILNGATFNWLPTILGAVDAIPEAIRHGVSLSEGYNYAKARADLDLYQARQNTGALGTAAGRPRARRRRLVGRRPRRMILSIPMRPCRIGIAPCGRRSSRDAIRRAIPAPATWPATIRWSPTRSARMTSSDGCSARRGRRRRRRSAARCRAVACNPALAHRALSSRRTRVRRRRWCQRRQRTTPTHRRLDRPTSSPTLVRCMAIPTSSDRARGHGRSRPRRHHRRPRT